MNGKTEWREGKREGKREPLFLLSEVSKKTARVGGDGERKGKKAERKKGAFFPNSLCAFEALLRRRLSGVNVCSFEGEVGGVWGGGA